MHVWTAVDLVDQKRTTSTKLVASSTNSTKMLRRPQPSSQARRDPSLCISSLVRGRIRCTCARFGRLACQRPSATVHRRTVSLLTR